jgi:hypothetical protein
MHLLLRRGQEFRGCFLVLDLVAGGDDILGIGSEDLEDCLLIAALGRGDQRLGSRLGRRKGLRIGRARLGPSPAARRVPL